ncbi:uncharacterized protein LOC129005538 [Macrosteles quadrilineatus]|uniref:uncharacterized protein LOC129005538 n=1 Tax=Macrosteles quadrilineatus TaxID=74068 RepID=UPI0023E2EEAB|nr:uncharacterized protein LOC129005538 [Macrosteles quadrilineatus]
MLSQTLLCVLLVPAILCDGDTLPPDLKAAPEARENQLESEILHHFQHLTYVADFVCREPQPRVVPVEKLLPSSVTWGKAYYPDVTVLHLCENSGACSSGYRCGPSHVNSVHLPFKVTYLEDLEYHKKGSWSMEFHLLENHTHCACAEEPATERPKPITLPVTPPNPPPARPNNNNYNLSYNPSYNPSYNNNPSQIRPPIPPPLSSPPNNNNPRNQENQ